MHGELSFARKAYQSACRRGVTFLGEVGSFELKDQAPGEGASWKVVLRWKN